jgi:L-amino acid N-acyltransferase YncA
MRRSAAIETRTRRGAQGGGSPGRAGAWRLDRICQGRRRSAWSALELGLELAEAFEVPSQGIQAAMKEIVIGIRRARAEDAVAVAEVFAAAWREAYAGIIPGVALEQMLARRGPAWWRSATARRRPLVVLDVADTVAGYIAYGRCRDRSLPAEGEIDEFYLAPQYQGLGFGRRMLNAVRNEFADRGVKRVAVWALAEKRTRLRFLRTPGGRRIAETRERIAGREMTKVAFLFR